MCCDCHYPEKLSVKVQKDVGLNPIFLFSKDKTHKLTPDQVPYSICRVLQTVGQVQFHVASPLLSAGESKSVELHKEPTDKDALRSLLVSLISCFEEIVYADEVEVTAQVGPHGKLDILVGCQPNYTLSQLNNAIVVKLEDDDVFIHSVILGESKQSATVLAKKMLRKIPPTSVSTSSPTTSTSSPTLSVADSVNTVQPVVQLLTVSHILSNSHEPYLLFFGTRTRIRPYIYFKSVDIMLTTCESLIWRGDSGLKLDTVTFLASLVQAHTYDSEIHYVNHLPNFLCMKKFCPTGYAQAVQDVSIKATLKATTIPQQSRHLVEPECELSPNERKQRQREDNKLFSVAMSQYQSKKQKTSEP